MTGGEPLLRPDVFDLAQYGNDLGFRMTMATNGTLLTPQVVQKMIDSGIQRISVSLDGAAAESHDAFRKVQAPLKAPCAGLRLAREAKLDFQINTTITDANIEEFPKIHELAVSLGAVAHHIFMLVPMGRGKDLAEEGISAEKYEKTLHWFYEQRGKAPLQLKATCAPHYYRILRQRAKVRRKGNKFRDLRARCRDARLPGGKQLCIHITRRPGAALRIPGGGLRKRKGKIV